MKITLIRGGINMNIDGIILVNEFNTCLGRLNQRQDINTQEKLYNELIRMFPLVVKKSEIITKLRS